MHEQISEQGHGITSGNIEIPRGDNLPDIEGQNIVLELKDDVINHQEFLVDIEETYILLRKKYLEASEFAEKIMNGNINMQEMGVADTLQAMEVLEGFKAIVRGIETQMKQVQRLHGVEKIRLEHMQDKLAKFIELGKKSSITSSELVN